MKLADIIVGQFEFYQVDIFEALSLQKTAHFDLCNGLSIYLARIVGHFEFDRVENFQGISLSETAHFLLALSRVELKHHIIAQF